jgi:hypothetical protein
VLSREQAHGDLDHRKQVVAAAAAAGGTPDTIALPSTSNMADYCLASTDSLSLASCVVLSDLVGPLDDPMRAELYEELVEHKQKASDKY